MTGKWEKIGGVESYVATPAGDYAKDKVVLFLSDIYGPQLPNAQVSLSEISFIRDLLAGRVAACRRLCEQWFQSEILDAHHEHIVED